MSLNSKVLPLLALSAALLAACSDGASSTQPVLASGSALAAKGGTGGGGGGGGGGNGGGSGGNVQLVITTPPTVNATGTWTGTTDGPDVVHTYTFTLTQTSAGSVSGVSSFATATQNGFEVVVGTVNGDTLALYAGAGTVSPGAQLVPYYRGIVSGSRIDGAFVATGVSPTFIKK